MKKIIFVIIGVVIFLLLIFLFTKRYNIISKFTWPANGKIVLKPTWHNMAIDIANTSSAPPVKAAMKGKIIKSDCIDKTNGCSIIIDHQNGFFTLYSHNKQNGVRVDDYVEKGQKIAVMGSLLHFELFQYSNGNKVLLNPLKYLPFGFLL